MKRYQTLMLAGFLVAAPLLAGCGEPDRSGAPKADTTQQIQQGNNPSDQPGQNRKPGAPGAAPSTSSGGR